MKSLNIVLLIVIAVFVISCAKQMVDQSAGDVKEPVTEQPTAIQEAEIVVEDVAGTGLEPVVIEIVAAREITPFNPKVKVGQEVVFVNKHVEGKEDREYTIRGDRFANFESPLLKPGDEWSHTFEKAGDYQYAIMPGAAGRISVVGNVIRKLFS